MVDFQGTKLDLAGINKYLETADVELTETEKQKLNSIFTDSDTFNDETKANGKDGKLNNEEWNAFVAQIKNHLPNLLKSILGYKSEQIIAAHLQAEMAKVAPPDGTLVAPAVIDKPIKIEQNNDTKNLKETTVQKMYEKWSKKCPNSNLTPTFYEKVYDLLDTLKIEVPDKDWDKQNYSSAKEQAMDQVIAIFAGESKLDPTAKKSNIYYGLFQLGKSGLIELKRYAKKHPNEKDMDKISNTMTLNNLTKLSAEKQLDYLVPYISKCKEYSNISKDQPITPAQLWAMIKYPFKGKSPKLIREKNDSIIRIIERNCIK